ncbi:uncharacterized protein LOC134712311 isoform X2 [Mytilus trossulus]|uniref:uncharacterized protein LOC134712311 isoform X2 n=1 Tax=Mytilus trossulus TaxID=6551 RepID=UPI0030079C1B
MQLYLFPKMATGRDPNVKDDEDPWLKAVENADVFVMYNNDDEYEISKYIFTIFQNNKVAYVSPEEHIMPGFRTYQAIDQAISASKKMLLILSKESIENFSFSLETLLALEKSLQTNKLRLIILLKDGLGEENIPKLPMLQLASHVILERNLHEKCIMNVIEMIRADVTIDSVLPAGNLAAGMAWSHFTGYLELVLPELAQGIKKSDWFNDNPGHMPLCLFMLLPHSGRSTGKLGDDDRDVEEVGQIEIIINHRPYSPKVCKVTERDKNGHIKSEYFCVAQYPGAFCALGTIKEEILCSFTKTQRDVEVQRFYHYLNEILNHEKYKQYGVLTKMLMYDDEEKGESATISYQLRQGVHDVIKNQLEKAAEGVKKAEETEHYRDEVCLLYHAKDTKLVFKVKDHLDKNKIRYSQARPASSDERDGDSLSEIERRVRDARWVILFITESSNRDMISMFLAEILSIGIETNSLNVIPVLNGITPTAIPSFIRWARHISIDRDEDYLDMIVDAVRGKDVSMKSQIPVGNVAYGLAWGFFVNYLKHVLPDFRERVMQCMSKDPIRKYREKSRRNVVVSQQMWEIIPKSCKFRPTLSEVDTEIKGPWRVEKVEKHLHGAKRIFPCNLWHICTRDTDYYFAAEYLTPVKTLYNMHISMIAGLSYEQMMHQREDLTEQLRGILTTASKREEYQEKCGIIVYDDSSDEPLSSVIINTIKKETGHKAEHDALLRYLSKDEEK